MNLLILSRYCLRSSGDVGNHTGGTLNVSVSLLTTLLHFLSMLPVKQKEGQPTHVPKRLQCLHYVRQLKHMVSFGSPHNPGK